MSVKLFKNALFFTAQPEELDAASLLKQDYSDPSAVANRFRRMRRRSRRKASLRGR